MPEQELSRAKKIVPIVYVAGMIGWVSSIAYRTAENPSSVDLSKLCLCAGTITIVGPLIAVWAYGDR